MLPAPGSDTTYTAKQTVQICWTLNILGCQGTVVQVYQRAWLVTSTATLNSSASFLSLQIAQLCCRVPCRPTTRALYPLGKQLGQLLLSVGQLPCGPKKYDTGSSFVAQSRLDN